MCNLINERNSTNAMKNGGGVSSVFYISISVSDKEGHMSCGNNEWILIRKVELATCHGKWIHSKNVAEEAARLKSICITQHNIKYAFAYKI